MKKVGFTVRRGLFQESIPGCSRGLSFHLGPTNLHLQFTFRPIQLRPPMADVGLSPTRLSQGEQCRLDGHLRRPIPSLLPIGDVRIDRRSDPLFNGPPSRVDQPETLRFPSAHVVAESLQPDPVLVQPIGELFGGRQATQVLLRALGGKSPRKAPRRHPCLEGFLRAVLLLPGPIQTSRRNGLLQSGFFMPFLSPGQCGRLFLPSPARSDGFGDCRIDRLDFARVAQVGDTEY